VSLLCLTGPILARLRRSPRHCPRGAANYAWIHWSAEHFLPLLSLRHSFLFLRRRVSFLPVCFRQSPSNILDEISLLYCRRRATLTREYADYEPCRTSVAAWWKQVGVDVFVYVCACVCVSLLVCSRVCLRVCVIVCLRVCVCVWVRGETWC